MKKVVVFAMIILGVAVVSYLMFSNDSFGKQAQNQVKGDLLLPDVVTSPPQELYIESSSNVRNLRFSTTFFNQGQGPLELVGRPDQARQVTRATQRIKKTDGTVAEKEIGEFVLHPEHRHWHVENYVEFQLWSYQENGEKEDLLATTNKMSFCIYDQTPYDLSLENAPRVAQYRGCPGEIQGLSVGWSDTYRGKVEGQELDIRNIPDGDYLVRTIVNPDQKISESNYENNEVVVYIAIKGNSIERNSGP